MNAAAILSSYADDEEKEKKAAAVFHATLGGEAEQEEKNKAAADCIRRIRLEKLAVEARQASSIEELQRIMKEQSEMKSMKIDIRGDSND